jgi:chromosome segregation ATPase
MLLERAEADKVRLSESKNKIIIELRESYASHIEHISMTCEDYLNTGMVLHNRIKLKDKFIEERDNTIENLERRTIDLENEISSQKIMRDDNRLLMETLGMQLDEEKTAHEYYYDEFLKVQKNYDGLETALNLRNKANDNLMIERNKARGMVTNLKALLKKQEAEIKINKTKIIELKNEADTLSTEKKMIIKERDHHYKVAPDSNI